MVLVDIGNTNIHVYKNGAVVNMRHFEKIEDEIYYISVNAQKEKIFKDVNPHALNLKKFVRFNTSYTGLGIDRIMACKSVKNGVVVDAGSAVTIDVMKNSSHLGGVIMPGLYSFKKAFGTISEVLRFEFDIIAQDYPKNTSQALNMGSVGAVKCIVEKYAGGLPIYVTGGDGEFFSRVLNNAVYIEDLVFRGMIKTIEEMELV